MRPRTGKGNVLALALAVEDDREFYEERAAIIEHEAKVPRGVAERIARERTKETALLRRRLLVQSIERAR